MSLENLFKVAQVSKKLKINEETVRRRARLLGIEVTKVGSAFVFTAEEVELIAVYQEPRQTKPPRPASVAPAGTLTSKDAGAMIGLSGITFVRRARELGIEPVKKGEKTTYWTPAQVQDVERRYPTLIGKSAAKKQQPIMPFITPEKQDAVYEEQVKTITVNGKQVQVKYMSLCHAR
jgi:hypothetical protein